MVNLEKIKHILTVLMVISLPFSESLKTISLLFLLLILIIQLYKKEATIELSPIHYGFIFLLFSGLISSIFAENPHRSMEGVKDILFYIIPFFVACSISNERPIKIILWGLYISTTMAAIYGIFHSLVIYKPLEIHSLGNQNYTAMFLITVVTSMISTIIFSDRETKSIKIIMGILVSLILIAAVMTVMRTSFLAFIIFLAILFLRYRQLNSVKLISIILLGLIIASIFFYKPMLLKIHQAQSLISRLYIWQHAFDLFRENLIIGIGLNHFKFTFPPTYIYEQGTLFDAHSVYFQTASQMGLFGILSLLLIVYGFIYKWIKFKTTSDFEKVVKYSALGGFLVTFVGGILDTTLHHEHAIVFTLFAGLMFGLFSKQGESRVKS